MSLPKPLCRLDELADPGARGPFPVMMAGERRAVFVVRCGDEVFAYVDSCPHVGAPLALEPDGYLDLSGTEILCAMHGARFAPETGTCTLGPCRGRRLTPCPVHIRNGMVIPDSPTEAI